MIVYNKKNSWKIQIRENIKELENYRNSYNQRIKLYNVYINIKDMFKCTDSEKEALEVKVLTDKIKIFQTQITKIDNNLRILNNIIKDENSKIDKKTIDKYNQKYREIRNNYLKNSLGEEDISIKHISNLVDNFNTLFEELKQDHVKEIDRVKSKRNQEPCQYIKDTNTTINSTPELEIDKNIKNNNYVENNLQGNNTLLISEKQNKVILPYTVKELLDILKNPENNYKTIEDVIEKEFTRDLSNYSVQFISRYIETMKLARKRENYSLFDAISLATEMMGKRLLYPAIISACKTLNDLDVYLDCLDKNELDDFKIFKIKYELYPMVVRQKRRTRF